MFTALALDAAQTNRTNEYFSVSVLDDPDYFERPFIRVLSLELDHAVARVAAVEKSGTRTLIRVDRILIVPTSFYPEGASVATTETINWWKKVYNSLGKRMSEMETLGPDSRQPLEISLRVTHEEAIRGHSIPVRDLDFGLYGDEAVGVYSAEGRSSECQHDRVETLTIHEHTANGPPEFADRKDRWIALQHPNLPKLTWRQVVSRLRLGPEITDPT